MHVWKQILISSGRKTEIVEKQNFILKAEELQVKKVKTWWERPRYSKVKIQYVG